MRNVSPRGLVMSLVLAAILPTLVFFGAGSPIAAAGSTPVTMPSPTAAHTPTPQPFQETGTPVLTRQATPVPAAGPPAADHSGLILALGAVVVVGGMLVGLIGMLRSR